MRPKNRGTVSGMWNKAWPFLLGAVGITVLMAAVAYWHDIVSFADAHEGLAAWAQLVGVLIALGATLYAAWLPVRHSIQLERSRELRAYRAVIHAAVVAVGSTTSFVNAIEQYAADLDEEWINEQAAEALATMAGAPVGDVETIALAQTMSLLRLAVKGARNSALNAMTFHAEPPALAQALQDARDWDQRGRDHLIQLIGYANAAGCDFRIEDL